MTSYLSLVMYGVGGMALLVAFQENLVYVPVLPGLTKSYPITPYYITLGPMTERWDGCVSDGDTATDKQGGDKQLHDDGRN
ncbi:hypothetical protein Tco_0751808 [Tanacetum coccineum]|uniref:Uncharacterized protein n=1 Tax=Tanacetum coccineum TaxID=301880 RepID=A0ABQ4Z7W8_9ASTR